MFRSSFNFFCGIFIFVYWNRAAAEWMLKISKVTFLVLLQFICTYFLVSYGQVSFNCVIIICQFIHGSILIKIDVAGSRSQTKRNLNTTKKNDNGKNTTWKKVCAQRKCRWNVRRKLKISLRIWTEFESKQFEKCVHFSVYLFCFFSVSFLLKNAHIDF